MFLRMLLDSMTDITYKRVGLGCLHAYLQTLLGHSHQPLFLGCGLAYDKHARGIGIIPVHDGGHIHVDDIALLQHIGLFGNAVAHHLVNRGAHTLGIAFITQTGGCGIVLLAVCHTDIVYLLRGHPHMYLAGHLVETTRIDQSTLTDSLYLFGSLDERPRGHLLAFSLPIHYLLVQLCRLLSGQTVPASFLMKHLLMLKKLVQNYSKTAKPPRISRCF